MIKQNPAKWIAVTAMGVALVVVAQFLGSRIPSIATIFGPFSVQQLITGTLVNCILLVFTARAGIASGAVMPYCFTSALTPRRVSFRSIPDSSTSVSAGGVRLVRTVSESSPGFFLTKTTASATDSMLSPTPAP